MPAQFGRAGCHRTASGTFDVLTASGPRWPAVPTVRRPRHCGELPRPNPFRLAGLRPPDPAAASSCHGAVAARAAAGRRSARPCSPANYLFLINLFLSFFFLAILAVSKEKRSVDCMASSGGAPDVEDASMVICRLILSKFLLLNLC